MSDKDIKDAIELVDWWANHSGVPHQPKIHATILEALNRMKTQTTEYGDGVCDTIDYINKHYHLTPKHEEETEG